MSYQKQWDAFVLYMEEHSGAFDKYERLGIKWADLEIKRLRARLKATGSGRGEGSKNDRKVP